MRHCIAGEIIFHEGDMPAQAFIIEEGEVEIFKTVANGRVLLATLGKGELFGEMGLIDDNPRSASAVARMDTHLRIVTREMIQQVLPTQPREFVIGAGLDKSNWLGLSNGKKTLQNRWLQAKQVA